MGIKRLKVRVLLHIIAPKNIQTQVYLSFEPRFKIAVVVAVLANGQNHTSQRYVAVAAIRRGVSVLIKKYRKK